MRLPILFLSIMLITISCSGTKNMTSNGSSHPIIFMQNGNEESTTKSDFEVTLKKEAFEIQFFNKQYDEEGEEFNAVQIAALTSPELIEATKPGMEIINTILFAKGSGLAAYNDGYHSLLVDYNGHHYLTYTSETDRRVRKIGQNGEFLKLAFDIPGLEIDGEEINIQDFPETTIYLAIFINKNLDGVIDKGELTKVKVNFE